MTIKRLQELLPGLRPDRGGTMYRVECPACGGRWLVVTYQYGLVVSRCNSGCTAAAVNTAVAALAAASNVASQASQAA